MLPAIDLEAGAGACQPRAMPLSRRQCRVLCRLFEEPTRADIGWRDFETLVVALGGKWAKSGRTAGSRRRAVLRGVRASFHAPHPGSEMKKGSAESARLFLQTAGATPEVEGCEC